MFKVRYEEQNSKRDTIPRANHCMNRSRFKSFKSFNPPDPVRGPFKTFPGMKSQGKLPALKNSRNIEHSRLT